MFHLNNVKIVTDDQIFSNNIECLGAAIICAIFEFGLFVNRSIQLKYSAIVSTMPNVTTNTGCNKKTINKNKQLRFF